MNKKVIAISALIGVASIQASAQAVLLAGWNSNSVPGFTEGSTFGANISDLYAGDGLANDAASGMLFADGQFGSSNISNAGGLTFQTASGDSNFNTDILTSTRPLGAPEMNTQYNNLLGDPSPGNVRLTISDGTFGVGGAADPSGKYITFAAFAPSGAELDGPITFSYAIGNNFMDTNEVFLSYSKDGLNFTNAGSVVVGGGDQLGTNVSFSVDALTEDVSAAFFRMQVPTVGFGSLDIDNVQIVGAVPEPSTVAAIVGFLTIALVAFRRRRK